MAVERGLGDAGHPGISERDWPTYQAGPANWGFHPRADGPGKSPSERWRFDVGGKSFMSLPAVVDGTVYVGPTGSASPETPHALYALDAETGDPHWQFGLPNGLRGSPSITDGVVYVRAGPNMVYAVDADTGEQRWRFEFDNTEGTPRTNGPTVADGTVFVAVGGQVIAIDADSGTEAWQYEVQTEGRVRMSTPAVLHDTVYVSVDLDTVHNRLHAVAASDGTERWRAEEGDIRGAPTVAGDTVYVGRYVPNVDREHKADGRVVAFATDDGSERWRTKTRYPAGKPATDGETLYVPTNSESNGPEPPGAVVALDRADRSELWRRELKGHIRTPVVTDDTVYIALAAAIGHPYFLVAMDADDGSERWRFEIDSHVPPRSPVVAGDRVYIGTDSVHMLE